MRSSFKTIEYDCGPVEIKERGSKFISFVYPVSSKEEAEGMVKDLRVEYHDATHVCYAYVLGAGEEDYFRYNDDGEPSGTAGIPIYNEIKRLQLFNVLVAVVRYFGGTRLGTGGLARAYGQSARLVLESATTVEKQITRRFEFHLPFDLQGEMMSVINHLDINIVSQDYDAEGVYIELSVPLRAVEEFKNAVAEKSAGRIVLE